MFDKNLFFALCEKYNVELSDSAKKPMINDGSDIREVTNEDVSRIFAPYQTSFEYSGKKLDAATITKVFYLQENIALAC